MRDVEGEKDSTLRPVRSSYDYEPPLAREHLFQTRCLKNEFRAPGSDLETFFFVQIILELFESAFMQFFNRIIF